MTPAFRDGRLPPFAWISRAAAGVLMDEFQGRERAMALSIYTALTLLSSEQLKGNHDGIIATRKQVAAAAGVSPRTVDGYCDRMTKRGLIEVTRRMQDGVNLPNIWTLIEPEGGGAGDAPPTHPLRRGGAEDDGGVAQEVRPFKEEQQLKKPNNLGAAAPTGSSEAKRARARAKAGPEAIRLCGVMGDSIRQRDPLSQSDPGSPDWLDEMRLLIGERGGDVGEVERVLRWTLADDFNQNVVLSPAKLRKRFTDLKLKADKADGQRRRQSGRPEDQTPETQARIEAISARLAARAQDPQEDQTPPSRSHEETQPRRVGREGSLPDLQQLARHA